MNPCTYHIGRETMKRAAVFLGLVGALTLAPGIRAQVFSSPVLNTTVPDGSFVGTTSSLMVSDLPMIGVGQVNVTLEITGSHVGDLYVQLVHDGDMAVLLNRVGKTAANPLGYGDQGLNVKFSESGSLGDVHNYRLTLFGNHNTPLAGPLTGTWAPDARNSNPTTVLDSDARNASLNSFVGADPNGAWTLFVGDVDPGSEHVLVKWALEIALVPEPGELPLIFGSICLLSAVVGRLRRLAISRRQLQLRGLA